MKIEFKVAAWSLAIVAAGLVAWKIISMPPYKPVIPPTQPRPAQRSRASAEPRGKVPWATGDVDLWDDDNSDVALLHNNKSPRAAVGTVYDWDRESDALNKFRNTTYQPF
jgi:hypothetical protein